MAYKLLGRVTRWKNIGIWSVMMLLLRENVVKPDYLR